MSDFQIHISTVINTEYDPETCFLKVGFIGLKLLQNKFSFPGSALSLFFQSLLVGSSVTKHSGQKSFFNPSASQLIVNRSECRFLPSVHGDPRQKSAKEILSHHCPITSMSHWNVCYSEPPALFPHYRRGWNDIIKVFRVWIVWWLGTDDGDGETTAVTVSNIAAVKWRSREGGRRATAGS